MQHHLKLNAQEEKGSAVCPDGCGRNASRRLPKRPMGVIFVRRVSFTLTLAVTP